jgi:hypothetical protein
MAGVQRRRRYRRRAKSRALGLAVAAEGSVSTGDAAGSERDEHVIFNEAPTGSTADDPAAA